MGAWAPVWRRWVSLEWVDKFGLVVVVGFLTFTVVGVACTGLNGDRGPTMPPLPSPSYTHPPTVLTSATMAP